jgi:methyl-accepting chemotaxis protein
MLRFINHRLSIATRLTLISILFAIPVVLLAAQLLNQGRKDIDFASKEVGGAAYVAEIWSSLTSGGAPASDWQANDAQFNTGDASKAFTGASGRTGRAGAAADLIGAVADASNLTLDPDLDSFYAMDAATVRLPMLWKANVELVAAAGSTAADRATTLALAFDHLDTAAGQAEGSLDNAVKDNAAGLTRQALAGHIGELKAALAAVKAAANDPGALASAQKTLDQRIDETEQATNVELTRLLKARIDRLWADLRFQLGVAAMVFLLGAMAAVMVARGMSGGIARQLSAMERLARNDTGFDVPDASDRNETGRIARALEVFKTRLIERDRLEVAAQASHRQTESKLDETREAFERAGADQSEVLEQIAAVLRALADGDLTARIRGEAPAAFRTLQADFDHAIDALHHALSGVADAAGSVQTGAGELTSATDDLAARTERQAHGAQDVAETLQRLGREIAGATDAAKRARGVVDQMSERARQSGEVTERAASAMSEILESSKRIAQITGLIDEIAFQTNLLALNAGVEAARAGEAGKGFAVVATEVRALAQRCATAAKEIDDLIVTSTQKVELGAGLVAQTSESVSRLGEAVGAIDGMMGEIDASAARQSAEVEHVNKVMHQIDEFSQRNAAMVEESSAATRALAAQADRMAELVARFRLAGRRETSRAA